MPRWQEHDDGRHRAVLGAGHPGHDEKFVLLMLLLAVTGIAVSVMLAIRTGQTGWWSMIAPVCTLVGVLTNILTPRMDNGKAGSARR